MSQDPLAAMLRADAARLLDAAPPTNAAAMWHRIRRARARRMQRALNLCAWAVRGIAAVGIAAVLLLDRPALAPALAIVLLLAWLASGMTAPAADKPSQGE